MNAIALYANSLSLVDSGGASSRSAIMPDWDYAHGLGYFGKARGDRRLAEKCAPAKTRPRQETSCGGRVTFRWLL